MANTVPAPPAPSVVEEVAPLGALTSPFTISIGTDRILGSSTRTAWTPNPSGKVQPVSSYGRVCGSLGAQY
jgi:hypothetical protein